MTNRDDRKHLMRGIVAMAFNAHSGDVVAFRRQVHAEGKQKLGSIIVVLTLISIAIKCYMLWRSLQLTTAPVNPVAGEPSFDIDGE